MAAATLLMELDRPVVQTAPLVKCLYLQLLCRTCGQYTVAIGLESEELIGIYASGCFGCQGPVMLISRGVGKTTHELPHVSSRRKRRWEPSWLSGVNKNGDRRNQRGGNKPGSRWRRNPTRDPEREMG